MKEKEKKRKGREDQMAAMDRAAEDLGLDDGQDTAPEIPEATEGESPMRR